MSEATSSSGAAQGGAQSFLSNRWLILFFSILSMVAVANFQYGWTLFVPPLQKHLHQEAAVIQIAFTVFVLLETWLVPFEGWLVDKFGPRLLVILGGIAAGLGWVFSGWAETVTALYGAYALAGVGAGIVYGTAVGSAMKWFPEHRGFAAGLTAAGFGAGSALTVSPIANLINSAGYQTAFIRWGIIQGLVVVFAALFLRAPPEGWSPKGWKLGINPEVQKRQSTQDFAPGQMASTQQFWLMYLMMTLVATGGLMAVAQLNPMAVDFKVDKVPVRLLFITLPALQFALSADRVINGLCRPFWGWVSDHIGRERTMALAFTLEAIAIFVLIQFARDPLLFVIFSAFTFFGWGEIFSLFPALCGDFFGRKNATANYGFLYTAKGTASVFVPIGSALAAGKAFDFRADILLILGAALIVFTLFLAPRVFHLELSKRTREVLLVIAAFFLIYGISLTVMGAKLWTPFDARFTLPKVGWAGVFRIAIFFDLIAAALAIFVLRRMKVPDPSLVTKVAAQPARVAALKP